MRDPSARQATYMEPKRTTPFRALHDEGLATFTDRKQMLHKTDPYEQMQPCLSATRRAQPAYTHLSNVSGRDAAITQLCPEIILVKVLEGTAVVVALRIHLNDKHNATINHHAMPRVLFLGVGELATSVPRSKYGLLTCAGPLPVMILTHE